MVELKLSRSPEGSESKISNGGNKGQVSKSKKYRGKKPQNKPIPDPKTETDFQVWCTDLKGYTFDLGPRAPEKSAKTMY